MFADVLDEKKGFLDYEKVQFTESPDKWYFQRG